MFRPFDNVFVETVVNFTTHDPIIPYGVFAVNADGSGFKLGDGVNAWSNLTYQGSSAIRNKQVQSSREPTNNELLIFCDSTDKWIYRLQHCFDTVTNWESSTSVFPTSTLLIETANLTSIPTGRFKIGDGSTSFDNLPWFGTDFNLSDFSVGESIEFNGSGWDPVTYMKSTELQSATIPTGKFHKDDGTWANMDTFTGLETVEADQGVFSTVYVGGFPTESTTVTLTSDGTDLFSDGNKVWTQYNDGTGSGLDADTLDGHHADTFLVMESSGSPSNLCIFGTTGNDIIDSGYSPSDFIVMDAMVYKGAIDCSSNPDFPTADVGDLYKVSVSGLIGGEFGTTVVTGDNVLCNTDTEAGEFASVGTSWDIIPNYTGGDPVIGPESSVDNNIVIFDGISGNVIKDSGYNINEFVTIAYVDETFPTVPTTTVSGNIVIFNSTNGLELVDSESSISDFSTTDHTHDYSGTFLGLTAKATDSDKLDGMDSTAFATIGTIITHPDDTISGNIVIFNSVDGKSIQDSGTSPDDFATTGDIATLIDEDDALAYSIAFGG